jgi:hypothetical protein
VCAKGLCCLQSVQGGMTHFDCVLANKLSMQNDQLTLSTQLKVERSKVKSFAQTCNDLS